MSNRTYFATMLVTVAATLQFAPSAQAAPAPSSPADAAQMSVRVPVADLDLHKAAGAKIALRRIHRAAVAICGDEPLSSGIARYSRFQGCVKSTVRAAVSLPGAQLASDPNAGSTLLEMVLAANP